MERPSGPFFSLEPVCEAAKLNSKYLHSGRRRFQHWSRIISSTACLIPALMVVSSQVDRTRRFNLRALLRVSAWIQPLHNALTVASEEVHRKDRELS